MENTGISSWIAGRINYRIIRRREYNARSTRLANIKSAQVFKVQQVDHALKAEMQRKVHELEDELVGIGKYIDSKRDEHQQLKQVHQAAQIEKKAIEAEKGQKQQEFSKWNKLQGTLGPSEEELKLKQSGGESYKSNIQILNKRQGLLAVKKAQEALKFGVSLAPSVVVIATENQNNSVS